LKIKPYILIVFALLTTWKASAQQDPLYSQYMFNLFAINPAYAGSRDALSATLSHRNQWVGFDGAPVTQMLAIHSPIKDKNMGVGLQFLSDAIGPKNVSGAMLSYAYRIKAGTGHLSFALRGGLLNYSFNFSDITFKDLDDEIAMNAAETFLVPTFDFGMFYYTKVGYFGMQISHLNEGKYPVLQSAASRDLEARLYTHASVTFGRAFEIDKDFVLKPSVFINAAEGGIGYMDINLSALVSQVFWIGASVRTGFGVIGLVEYDISRKFRVGYSYGYALNQLRVAQSGTHEIFIGYDFDVLKKRVTSPRYF
jgi:type IX secretion system PorP/SprF family membrane protein